MAREELMRQLPSDIERATESGSFFLRNNGGSYSVVVLTEIIVTCGGEDGKDRADQLASDLNMVWNQRIRTNMPHAEENIQGSIK